VAGLIHVGAWDGREYAGHEGPLLLFEPQADAFAQLLVNLAHKPGVMAVNCALGSAPGTATMYTAKPSHSSSLLRPERHLVLHPDIEFSGHEEVEVDTLDAVMEARGLRAFDTLVMDVQGFELEVLRGAGRTLQGIDRIRTEVNLEEVYAGCARIGDLDEVLTDFERVETDLHGPEGAWGDAVYVRRDPP
jgi:FkbM family methyltransferase